LVLIQITGEVAGNRALIGNLLAHLMHPFSEALFVTDYHYREGVFDSMESLTFPLTQSVMDRVHYLDRKTGACLVRGYGHCQMLQEACRKRGAGEEGAALRKMHTFIVDGLPLIAEDLQEVQYECELAAHQAGIVREHVQVGDIDSIVAQ